MESGAKGCEVIVSGKLRAQRAKAMKFKDGYMIASGHPAVEYIDGCVRHVMLRQGVLGIKASCVLLCLEALSQIQPFCHSNRHILTVCAAWLQTASDHCHIAGRHCCLCWKCMQLP